ncbi:hypothetical protein JOM56_014143 [Amanita muscaria]
MDCTRAVWTRVDRYYSRMNIHNDETVGCCFRTVETTRRDGGEPFEGRLCRVPGGSHMIRGSYPSSFELVEVEQTVWGRCLFKVVNRVRAILVIYCVLVCQDMYSMVEYNDTITTTSRRETLILSQGKQSGYQASTCVCSVENDAEPETVLLRLMAWELFSSDGERVEKRDSRLHEGSLNRVVLFLSTWLRTARRLFSNAIVSFSTRVTREQHDGCSPSTDKRRRDIRDYYAAIFSRQRNCARRKVEDHERVVNGIEVVKGAVGVPTALRWRRTHSSALEARGYHGGIIDCLEQSNRILQKCGRDHVRMVQGVCDREHVEKGDRLREGSLKSSTSVFCSRTLQQPFLMPVSSNYLNSWAHIDIMASLPFFGEGDTPPREGYQLNGNSLMFRTSWTIRDGPKILLSRQRMRTLSGKTHGVLISITKDCWERIGCTEVLAIDGNSEASGDLEVEFQQHSAVGHRVQRSTAAGISSKNARIMPGDFILAAEGSRNTGRSLKPGYALVQNVTNGPKASISTAGVSWRRNRPREGGFEP